MMSMHPNRSQHVVTTDAARLLRPHELAAFLGIPLRTIYRWRSRHEGPPSYRVGRHIRYRLNEVEQWLDERRDEHREAWHGDADRERSVAQHRRSS
jgi:excisionase family DNA binding protein